MDFAGTDNRFYSSHSECHVFSPHRAPHRPQVKEATWFTHKNTIDIFRDRRNVMYTSYHVIHTLVSYCHRNINVIMVVSVILIETKTGLSNSFVVTLATWNIVFKFIQSCLFLRVKNISLWPKMYGLCYICTLYNLTVNIRMLI